MGWRNRPTYKEIWPENIDKIMFIDENGDSSLKGIKKSFSKNLPVQPNNKFFTTTACVIKKEKFKDIKKDIMNLKRKYWNDGYFDYNGKTKRVCLHSNEIRCNKGPFSRNEIDYNSFINDLTIYMQNLDMIIFSSTLNKELHYYKYKDPVNPYVLCMNFILERFVKFYLEQNETAIIILESRGKKEDKKLLEHIKEIIDKGTKFVNKEYFKKIKGVYFNPKWSKKQHEKKSYFCLEIADLSSYPIHKYNTKNIKDKAFSTIEKKIYKYPNYSGKGIKTFP